MPIVEFERLAGNWSLRQYGTNIESIPATTSGKPGAKAGVNSAASWPLPASNFAVWDPTNGNDSNAGTVGAPVKTLPSALSKITAGGTVVVRGGVHSGAEVGYRIASAAGYNASLGYGGLNVSKQCTIQPYPGEQVTFDGTRNESGGWTAGSGYWSKPISITIDRGVTDQYGQLDNNVQFGWIWVRGTAWHNLMTNAGYTHPDALEMFPLASWNEQVWIDDVQQQQVATLGEVGPGKFYVSGSTGGTNNVLFTSNTYYLGTNPTGKSVRVGELSTSLRLGVAGSTLRGIKFRRFCGSNHMGGILKATANNVTFDNVIVEDASATAWDLFESSNTTLVQCEIMRAGNLGLRHARSDNLTFDRCKGQYNNIRRYNTSPVSGALKGSTSRNVLVKDCDFTHNYTKGVWWDVSCYDVRVVNCALDYNEEAGAVFEIGAKGLLANCTLTYNGIHGLIILNYHAVDIWNCTFAGNGTWRGRVFDGNHPRDIKAFSDNRRVVDSPPGGPGTGTYPGYGRDSRQPMPDPTMNNWLIQSITVRNCIFAPGDKQFAYFPVEDLQKSNSQSREWTDYGIVSNGNLFNRLATNNPAWAFLIPHAGTTQTIFQGANALTQWRSTTGQDASSIEIIGPSVCAPDGWLTTPNKALYGKGGAQCPAVALPADIAALVGVPTGDRHVGAYEAI